MEGVGVALVLFDAVVFEVGGVDVQALAGGDAAFVEGVFIRVRERDEFVVGGEVRKGEGGDQSGGGDGGFPAPLEFIDERVEFGALGDFGEAADAGRDGVDLAAAEQADE